MRLWGKIQGITNDYYIAEGTLELKEEEAAEVVGGAARAEEVAVAEAEAAEAAGQAASADEVAGAEAEAAKAAGVEARAKKVD